MNTPSCTDVTLPILSGDATVWFSAYGFGWGYQAFALPVQTVCGQLGARDESVPQLKLAFELNRPRILRAVQTRASAPGARITLSPADL
ncbi:hypothetical protein [Paraburkholderia kururiensis]|uniref:Uncharacterized protein n=1 Tax=Paraburkholderia kururiensis TaxID=984307 RepID=A0ABZ0WHH2_9BURK|nr:hypothetical protein [Paraburkholderia kururiensis]WQD76809.1 hypothetical protein U0042_22410 [Paraburkholderia kururiensis]